MRVTALLLPLAISAAVIEPRQGRFSAAKLAGVDKAEPRFRKTAQRTITKFGRK